mmetsp:Transcript_10105/g.30233  ORF Transcript_10105/g.30233 Transcript_10105/m.30233 type:complete len:116 (-) Transcript_10105:1797-2144(-)
MMGRQKGRALAALHAFSGSHSPVCCSSEETQGTLAIAWLIYGDSKLVRSAAITAAVVAAASAATMQVPVKTRRYGLSYIQVAISMLCVPGAMQRQQSQTADCLSSADGKRLALRL